MAGRFKPSSPATIKLTDYLDGARRGAIAGPCQPPGKSIRLLRRQPACDLAHDRNDLLHDITAGAAGSNSQQIPHRGADLRLVRQANRQRRWIPASGRRNEVVYRPAVSRFDRAAVHFKDRDELNRRVPR
jgi:hypothetical protein